MEISRLKGFGFWVFLVDLDWFQAANAIGIAGDAELMNCDAGQMNYGAIGDSYRGGKTDLMENWQIDCDCN